MSAAKHTPGIRQRFPCGCEARAGIESISLVQCPLHAAAPDVLEALEATAFVLERGVPTCRRCKEPVEKHSLDHCEVAAAIAKAKGGTP